MQEIIKQILEGNFGHDNYSLIFSCNKIELILKKDEIYQGSFFIETPLKQYTLGKVDSTHIRMKCITKKLIGTKEEIGFEFNAQGMQEGETLEGNFYIISNHGEAYLPFSVKIEKNILESSIGGIENLFHFANLAKCNWEEAVKIFYSKNFINIFKKNEQNYKELYLGISQKNRNQQNVEEFLVAINKKQNVEYIVAEHELQIKDVKEISEYILNITKNSWGFTRINVEVEGAFLTSEKKSLSDDDFLGNICRLPIYINEEKLHQGKNFGRIVLYDNHNYIKLPVVVENNQNRVIFEQHYFEEKRALIKMMEDYQAFRLKKIGTSTWLKEAGKLVEHMITMKKENVFARLFQAQLFITEEEYNKAEWVLVHAKELIEKKNDQGDLLESYYFYLTTLLKNDKEYVKEIAEKVRNTYYEKEKPWEIGWLMLYLSEEYNRSAPSKFRFLEEQFYQGCKSPFMYMEALLLMNANPTFLRKLGRFEMQVLYYGNKKEALVPDLFEQILYLSKKEKKYSALLFSIFERAYKKNADERILREICSLLIKGNKCHLEHFKWFKLGVENELKITNLYEYYMISLPLEKKMELPQRVLLYFSYQNNLDYEHRAFLYVYIMKNRKKYSEIYANYFQQIEKFVIEQIQKEHINKDLAYLYTKFLTSDMITSEIAPSLAKILYTKSIVVEKSYYKNIIVRHEGISLEMIYPFKTNINYIQIYHSNYHILFEDIEGNRFEPHSEMVIEEIINADKYIDKLKAIVVDNIFFDMYIYEKELYASSDIQIERLVRIYHSKYIDAKIKADIAIKIIHYYYEQDKIIEVDEILEFTERFILHEKEKRIFIQYMVIREKYDLAYNWLQDLSKSELKSLEITTIVRLISKQIEKEDFLKDETLLFYAYYIFKKGKYNVTLLRYLSLHYEGLVKELHGIWKATLSFDVDCYELSERIIIQILFTGAYVSGRLDVFKYYVSLGAKPEIEGAFLAQNAYEYFVAEKIIPAYIIEEIKVVERRNESLHKVVKLAFIKYYSENMDEMREEDKVILIKYLEELLEEGIFLKHFLKFREYTKKMLLHLNKTVIEYKTKAHSKVKIHYLILTDEEEEEDEYQIKEMKSIINGVYVCEFTLFFGESLQYYIEEETEEEVQITESGTIQKSDIYDEEKNSRFETINDIVISQRLQDYDTFDYMLEEYYKTVYFSENLFHLK